MAKRSKTKATVKKAPPAEPFFRPFSGLTPARVEKPGEKKAPKPAPARVPTPLPVVEAAGGVDSFARYMSGVRALGDDGGRRIPTTASHVERAGAPAPADDPDADARARMGSLVNEGLRFETVDDGEHLEGRRMDVDPRELRRLRRAQYAIDGKLDLHGLDLSAARQAVEVFIKKRATDGDRVVLLVHGKGSHSPRGHAVLRGEIAAWLAQGRLARHVAAFATAPADHGGTGAVLVLLAR
jgi:DNA-nicking Smr family endonuclease